MKKLMILSLAFAASISNAMLAMEQNKENMEANKHNTLLDAYNYDDISFPEELEEEKEFNEVMVPFMDSLLALSQGANPQDHAHLDQLVIKLEHFKKSAPQSKLARFASFVGNNKLKIVAGLCALGVAIKYGCFNSYDLGIQTAFGNLLRMMPMSVQSLIEQGMQKIGSDFTTHAEMVQAAAQNNYALYQNSMINNTTAPCLTFDAFVKQNPVTARPYFVELFNAAKKYFSDNYALAKANNAYIKEAVLNKLHAGKELAGNVYTNVATKIANVPGMVKNAYQAVYDYATCKDCFVIDPCQDCLVVVK